MDSFLQQTMEQQENGSASYNAEQEDLWTSQAVTTALSKLKSLDPIDQPEVIWRLKGYGRGGGVDPNADLLVAAPNKGRGQQFLNKDIYSHPMKKLDPAAVVFPNFWVATQKNVQTVLVGHIATDYTVFVAEVGEHCYYLTFENVKRLKNVLETILWPESRVFIYKDKQGKKNSAHDLKLPGFGHFGIPKISDLPRGTVLVQAGHTHMLLCHHPKMNGFWAVPCTHNGKTLVYPSNVQLMLYGDAEPILTADRRAHLLLSIKKATERNEMRNLLMNELKKRLIDEQLKRPATTHVASASLSIQNYELEKGLDFSAILNHDVDDEKYVIEHHKRLTPEQWAKVMEDSKYDETYAIQALPTIPSAAAGLVPRFEENFLSMVQTTMRVATPEPSLDSLQADDNTELVQDQHLIPVHKVQTDSQTQQQHPEEMSNTEQVATTQLHDSAGTTDPAEDRRDLRDSQTQHQQNTVSEKVAAPQLHGFMGTTDQAADQGDLLIHHMASNLQTTYDFMKGHTQILQLVYNQNAELEAKLQDLTTTLQAKDLLLTNTQQQLADSNILLEEARQQLSVEKETANHYKTLATEKTRADCSTQTANQPEAVGEAEKDLDNELLNLAAQVNTNFESDSVDDDITVPVQTSCLSTLKLISTNPDGSPTSDGKVASGVNMQIDSGPNTSHASNSSRETSRRKRRAVKPNLNSVVDSSSKAKKSRKVSTAVSGLGTETYTVPIDGFDGRPDSNVDIEFDRQPGPGIEMDKFELDRPFKFSKEFMCSQLLRRLQLNGLQYYHLNTNEMTAAQLVYKVLMSLLSTTAGYETKQEAVSTLQEAISAIKALPQEDRNMQGVHKAIKCPFLADALLQSAMLCKLMNTTQFAGIVVNQLRMSVKNFKTTRKSIK